MPTNVVKKWAKESGISVKKAEEKWELAKEKSKGKENKWAYTMSIFKKLMKKENIILSFNQFNEINEKREL